MNRAREPLGWVPPANFDYRVQRHPQPVEGCETCTQLVNQRNASKEAGDISAVTDVNVLMRRHLGRAHRK